MSERVAGLQRPPGRYGEVRGTRRLVGLVALGTVGLVLLSYLLWVAWHHANPDVRAGRLSYEVRDDRTVEVVLEVVRPADMRVTCEVRAQNYDDLTVGTARAEVPTGDPERQVVSVVIPTTERAVGGELVRCSESGTD
jgi:hypothetical protein